jgi:hypothetical protein
MGRRLAGAARGTAGIRRQVRHLADLPAPRDQPLPSAGPAQRWPCAHQGPYQPGPAPTPPCCPCKAHQRHQRRSMHNDHQRPPAGRVATLRAPRRTVMPNRIANDINTNDWSFDRLDRLARALHPLVFPLAATTNTSTTPAQHHNTSTTQRKTERQLPLKIIVVPISGAGD